MINQQTQTHVHVYNMIVLASPVILHIEVAAFEGHTRSRLVERWRQITLI